MKFRLLSLSCLPLILTLGAQTPEPKHPVNCTVQGQIVQQPGGQPVRKAAIELAGTGNDDPDYHALTDADGRFKIDDVKPGSYRLYLGAYGFVEAEKRHHGSGMLLVLEPAQEVKDLLFHLSPAAVIIGKVRDDDGDPVRGVDVLAIPYGTAPHGAARSTTLHYTGQCSTNDLGECRISDLTPGRYLVATQPQFEVNPSVRKGSDKQEQTYATITIREGLTKNLQFRLISAPAMNCQRP